MAKKLKLSQLGKSSMKDMLTEIFPRNAHKMKDDQTSQDIFSDLRDQLDRRRARYTHDLNILRDRLIQDAETVRMALERLASQDKDAASISADKLARLKRMLNQELPDDESDDDTLSNIRAYEKYLNHLEKEILEILSKRFKK
jgi:hypothetical protein